LGTTSPVISPAIGAFILKVTSWQGVFVALSVIGFISLAGSLAMVETNTERLRGNIFNAVGRLGAVLKNKGFLSLLSYITITTNKPKIINMTSKQESVMKDYKNRMIRKSLLIKK
jgi:DHA1 family bicyclomycin/chloramphenicol resistance-like MFS transporter